MVAFQGMDVDAVRAIAAGLDARSAELTAAVAQIDGLVSHLASVWAGPDAQQFAQWWQQEHRPRLAAASQAVHGLGRSASNNASEQEQVSGAGTAANGTSASAGSATTPGAGTDTVGRVLHAGDTGFGLIDKGFMVDHHVLGHPSSAFGEGLGHVASGFGVASSGWDAYQHFAAGDNGTAWHDVADAGGSALSFGGPAAQLAAFDVKLYADVIDLGSQVHWSEGVPNPFSGNNLTEVWAPAMSETFGQLGGIIWGDL